MVTTGVPPDLADEFELRRRDRSVALVRSDFAAAFDELGLLESPEPGGVRRAPAGGRGGAWIAAPEGGEEAVVRPGRRGGWIARFNRSRYFAGDRFLDELVLTERLRRRGAPVPRPLAAVRRDHRIGYETWLATRHLPGTAPAARLIAAASADRLPALLHAVGRAVRALHEAGGDHADLNAWNVLIAAGETSAPEAWIVDLDRGRISPRPLTGRRARANLARLRRSFVKLGLASALEAWPALERGYASAPDASAAPDTPSTGAANCRS